ncbi:hypothetical protein N9H82_05285 [Flavobacteriaceae bacterium]|nr:hypothetical protein [Flavobacteriaceae bacterium]
MTQNKTINIGPHSAQLSCLNVKGEQMKIDGESFYKISNVNGMRPFFMSIVSHSNHWMFISSTGALSAGRKDSDAALFPYYTDDKITDSFETTGSKSIFLVEKNGQTFLWEPFSLRQASLYKISRNLYKNAFGNKVIFEEINHDLEIRFTYEWNSTDRYGFVRKSSLYNTSTSAVKVQFIDGIQNVLPYGIEEALQNGTSNLVDAYKRTELVEGSSLAIFALSAIIVDKAEPSEALKSNVAWSIGLENPTILLSSLQLDVFRRGQEVSQETDIKAEKGAYFLQSEVALESNGSKEWLLVADVNQTISDVITIKSQILTNSDLKSTILSDVELGSEQLTELVAASDGLQKTADGLRNVRHFSNTMFNIMRGGIFDDNYQIEKADFVPYIEKLNKKVYRHKEALLNSLPTLFKLEDLKALYQDDEDKNFKRLCCEYLPLKFSRRHGDPSRPWNKFSINTRNENDGSKILDYQGNWRDIFQNWEALAHSYPEFMEGMIHKFLNATTFDGYNPYRVTKYGFDWETIEPDNPWSYIGYWGDHQIIYLLKFLEFMEAYYPSKLATYFSQDLFVYANVPYKIKPYKSILEDPKNTIDFDFEKEENIQFKRDEIGVDGALLRDTTAFIYKVNFVEKILATVLAKMSNFIPEGGIWMNTQRPEWNDANNALVGNGVSMVTLYYLRRFLKFFNKVLDQDTTSQFEISNELLEFFNKVSQTLEAHKQLLEGSFTDESRKLVLDGLGQAASDYRTQIYDQKFSGYKTAVSKASLLEFSVTALDYLEHSIRANKRNDNLFHAYNLMTVTDHKAVSISYLPEMLEGQVAVLSSGYLSSQESLDVLDGLKNSPLFREDQYSYILYPNKELPKFVHKNTIAAADVKSSELLTQLLADGNTQLINQDGNGAYHFNGGFNNADSVLAALSGLSESYATLVDADSKKVLDIFESVFDHKSFTGRSGTFFGYEGLGSIYWHMVSKLLLAVYEVTQKALSESEDKELIGRLYDHYFEVNAGIGVHKSPELYGAFPTDAYSHTPGGKGAQQPGMTGQVKEDVLSRFGELGVKVRNGAVEFNPEILRTEEFLTTKDVFNYINLAKEKCHVDLEVNSLAFTYCQVPVIYQKASNSAIKVFLSDGRVSSFKGKSLDVETSQMLFNRGGQIDKLVVSVIKL